MSKVIPTHGLHPWRLGGLEGKPTKEVLKEMHSLIEKTPDKAPAGRGPRSTFGGESFNSFKNRFLGHVKVQMQNYKPTKKILNVTHYRGIRLLQAWVKKGANPSLDIDTSIMTTKGNDNPADLFRLHPDDKGQWKMAKTKDVAEPGIYFARHGSTEYNAENKDVGPRTAPPPNMEV